MAYEWIGAAAAGTASVIAGMAQHPSKARRYAKELALYNTELQNQQYEKYASPAAQMRQYKEAGLNPNLIYGQQIQGTPEAASAEYTDTPYADSSKVVAGISNAISAYYNIMGQQQALTNSRLVSQEKEKNIESKQIDNDYKRSANEYRLEGLAIDNARNRYKRDVADLIEVNRKKQSIDESIEKIKKSEMDRKEKDEKIKNLVSQRNLMELQGKLYAQSLKSSELDYKFNFETFSDRKKSIGLSNMNALAGYYNTSQHTQNLAAQEAGQIIANGLAGKNFKYFEKGKMLDAIQPLLRDMGGNASVFWNIKNRKQAAKLLYQIFSQ